MERGDVREAKEGERYRERKSGRSVHGEGKDGFRERERKL